MPDGYFTLVLHAHLPFVRHPEYDEFLEEEWLFEAITETYLPLLDIFERLEKDGVRYRITMTLSPTLLSMFMDELLRERYLRHLEKLIELSEKEMERTTDDPGMNELARMYNARFVCSRESYSGRYNCDLVSAFKRFFDSGRIEIITTAATHGFLPLLALNKTAVKAQILIAKKQYELLFDKSPVGIWLPECGYQRGFETILGDAGIRYFFVDAHGILNAEPPPRRGVFAPLTTPAGVAVFGRDLDSSRRVWSSKAGYPGHPSYRDFYRDIGFDFDLSYIGPYVQENGLRKMTGIKYHCITNGGEAKDIYDPNSAIETANFHAIDFVNRLEERTVELDGLTDRPPLIVSPFDAELFGHWWFEGPEFLESVLRRIDDRRDKIRSVTPSDYLDLHKESQISVPSSSSWGRMGYSDIWLNETNDWVYRHLHKAADRMVKVAVSHRNARGLLERALNQAARELLLAQASDWAFIMKTGAVAPYAEKRTKDHLIRFNRLYERITSGVIDEEWLSGIEELDNIFPEIDFKVYIR